jgi:hypothetical protein
MAGERHSLDHSRGCVVPCPAYDDAPASNPDVHLHAGLQPSCSMISAGMGMRPFPSMAGVMRPLLVLRCCCWGKPLTAGTISGVRDQAAVAWSMDLVTPLPSVWRKVCLPVRKTATASSSPSFGRAPPTRSTHSRTRRTRRPAMFRADRGARFRARVHWNFRAQGWPVSGSRPCRQPSCWCQNQPCAKVATFRTAALQPRRAIEHIYSF